MMLIPAQTMSQGTALFSCGLMEAARWRPSPEAVFGSGLDALWDSRPLQSGAGHCSSLSSLLRDLNLTSDSTAPPNKRQCRSYSSSDDLSRSSWRPQGSRVWTAVEKRRCLSGGSVHQRPPPAPAFPLMQRSSSLSLAFPGTPSCPPAPREAPPSGPGLARSRSQPCVSHEKKAAVKRRRPEESGEQRPSLDLAKMTQKLRSFHSLSCPGLPSEHGSPDLKDSPRLEYGPLDKLYSRDADPATKDSPAIEDYADATPLSTNQKDGEAFWAGRCSSYQLGGELDIEQIERN
uniref:Family with sequence similarity 53 member B n=1 Tax=Neogobius melanostomus TaxID=47308 RepID=A0A8C6UFP9_9GOBI